ncbi:MAG: hypothetical protein J6X92_02585 [Bacteroidales bacterium]|nr:hypothetical protein [Bacteroidales bacterium]MBP5590203.1 hypothetical protein [Bacteroidales bacterium]
MKSFVQYGYFLVAQTIVVMLLGILLVFLDKSSSQMDLWSIVAIVAICIFTILLSYKMIIVIDKETLFYSFGVGLIKKTIYLSDIEDCSVVKLSSIGLKRKLRTKSFNIFFTNKGVMITLNNSSKKIILGSRNAEEIKTAIDDAIIALKDSKRKVDNYYIISY